MEEKPKEKSGCLIIAMIFVSSILIAGIFYVVGGKMFGEEYRLLVFFGTLGTIGIIFLLREIFSKKGGI
ncbi:MAG TPA: hypothetical protein VF691_19375 [Cytophagaceae bacterium]|jgi:hypothetical protein